MDYYPTGPVNEEDFEWNLGPLYYTKKWAPGVQIGLSSGEYSFDKIFLGFYWRSERV